MMTDAHRKQTRPPQANPDSFSWWGEGGWDEGGKQKLKPREIDMMSNMYDEMRRENAELRRRLTILTRELDETLTEKGAIEREITEDVFNPLFLRQENKILELQTAVAERDETIVMLTERLEVMTTEKARATEKVAPAVESAADKAAPQSRDAELVSTRDPEKQSHAGQQQTGDATEKVAAVMESATGKVAPQSRAKRRGAKTGAQCKLRRNERRKQAQALPAEP